MVSGEVCGSGAGGLRVTVGGVPTEALREDAVVHLRVRFGHTMILAVAYPLGEISEGVSPQTDGDSLLVLHAPSIVPAWRPEAAAEVEVVIEIEERAVFCGRTTTSTR